MAVSQTVDSEASPLKEDREIRWLLQFRQGDPRADGMRNPGWHEPGVARCDRHLVKRVKDGGRVLVRHPAPDDRRISVAGEPEINTARVVSRLAHVEDDPRLGLA